MIKASIEEIQANIKEAAMKSGRDPKAITLIAVTKTRTIDEMKAVAQLGCVAFGENKVQELERKYDQFDDSINWHLIGHLQRNKVRFIVDKVKLIHSVDSIRLAKAINKEAAKRNMVANILVQVNIANEETKFGLAKEDVISMLKEIGKFENIKVKGLMAMAPYTDQAEDNRAYFRQIKDLSVDINSQKIDNIDIKELSMGMTNDYTVAIEEGATMIRIGTGIFGTRDYETNKEVL